MVIAIFVIGLFIGMMIETINSNKINNFYMSSEINLVDGLAISQIAGESLDCESLKAYNIEFADKIYQEAKLLEQYEEAGKLTNNLKLLHRRYDLLRTLAWMSNTNSLKECGNYNLIVYLYEYDTEDLTKKATQEVWSKILLDVKSSDENIVLIPIAVDQDITSLNLLLENYDITQYPAVIVNNKDVINNLETPEDLTNLINN